MKSINYSVIMLFFLTSNLFGQEYPSVYNAYEGNSQGVGVLPGNLLQIHNPDHQGQVSFSLSFDNRNWRTFSIDGNSSITLDLKKYNSVIINICTGDSNEKNCLKYRLMGANRYKMFWNNKKRKWDVIKYS